MTMSKRQAVVLGALLVLCTAPPARAGDPTAAAFRKLAKSQVAAIKGNAKTTVKTVKDVLKTASDGYADGSLTPESVLGSVLGPVGDARDALEDGALSAFTTLSADGHQLLLDAGLPAPGPDFQAGGRGAWDDALDGVEAALDKADDQLRAALAKFIKDMGKGAKAQGLAIDIRARLPAHGSEFWSVVPPAGNPASSVADGGSELPAPQILIEVRLVETNTDDTLGIAIRSGAPSVTVNVASTATDEQVGTIMVPGPSGVAAATFGTTGLDHPTGFITLQLDDGTLVSPVSTLSSPQIGVPNPGTASFLDAFRQDLKAAKKEFAHDAADALKGLTVILPSHIKAVAKGIATPELAVRTGFGNMRDAREALGVAWQNFTQTAADRSAALSATPFDDGELPGNFQPDFGPDYGEAVDFVNKLLSKRQTSISKACDKFVPKILKQAEKHGDHIGANWIVGRVEPFSAPNVTTAPSPPATLFVAPHITDAVVLVVMPALTEDFSVLLSVQADPNVTFSVGAAASTIPDGDEVDLGLLLVRSGGTEKTEVPLLGDVPILGWLFRTTNAENEHGPFVVIRPTLVTGGP